MAPFDRSHTSSILGQRQGKMTYPLVNPLIATLKPHGWAVTFGTATRGLGRAKAVLAVPNVTAHPSAASAPTSYYSTWHYNCHWSLKGPHCKAWASRNAAVHLFVCSFVRRLSSLDWNAYWPHSGRATMQGCPIFHPPWKLPPVKLSYVRELTRAVASFQQNLGGRPLPSHLLPFPSPFSLPP